MTVAYRTNSIKIPKTTTTIHVCIHIHVLDRKKDRYVNINNKTMQYTNSNQNKKRKSSSRIARL
jgi:hypothetical protein